MTSDLPLILLAVAVVAIGLWFILRPGKSTPKVDAPSDVLPKVDKPAAVEPVAVAAVAEVPAKAAEKPKGVTKPKVAAKPKVSAKAKAATKPEAVAKAPEPKAVAPKAAAKAKASAPPKAAKAPAPAKPAVAKAPAKAPVKAAAKPAAKSAAKPAPKAAKPAAPKVVAKPKGPDNLLWIKGLGPKLNTLFVENGVTRFDQIASWKTADITAMDEKLGNFSGRIARDNFVEQATLLAKGDIAGFEAKYGKLDSENR